MTKFNAVSNGDLVLARVSRMGARRGCAWRYCWYEAKADTKSGYAFCGVCTGTMFPNKSNYEYSEDLETRKREEGYQVVMGRPFAGKNAPGIING